MSYYESTDHPPIERETTADGKKISVYGRYFERRDVPDGASYVPLKWSGHGRAMAAVKLGREYIGLIGLEDAPDYVRTTHQRETVARKKTSPKPKRATASKSSAKKVSAKTILKKASRSSLFSRLWK